MTAPVRDGATVMLVRDGHHAHDPLEVCMVRRHPRTAFGGYHAFPGGVVDDIDHQPGVAARCRGRSDSQASALLGLTTGGLGFWVAALRETFEEVGILLARTDDGGSVPASTSFDRARLRQHRRGLTARQIGLDRVLSDERLHLTVDEVHYFAHWITPPGAPSRYDTRFFVALAPTDQAASHDDDELTACEWIRPAEALDRHRAGSFDLIEPTIHSLQAISRFATGHELLTAVAAAEAGVDGPLHTVADGGGRRIGLPGDTERAATSTPAGADRGSR